MIIIRNVILITVQTVTFYSELEEEMLNMLSLSQIFTRKMYVYEDIFFILTLMNIIKRINVHENLFFEDDENEKTYKNN